VNSSSQGPLAHELFENDNDDQGEESVEIDGLPAVDLTTASEFETGYDNDDGGASDGPGSQSDADKSMDNEVKEVSYRKVKNYSFLMFSLI